MPNRFFLHRRTFLRVHRDLANCSFVALACMHFFAMGSRRMALIKDVVQIAAGTGTPEKKLFELKGKQPFLGSWKRPELYLKFKYTRK